MIDAIILGLVEGLTEFIPVSSTGHLILVQNWLGFLGEKENAFIIFIQLGAILAVLWLYRQKFLNVALNLHRNGPERRLFVNLILGTIPAIIIGLPLDDLIESYLFKPIPVALALVIGGIAILLIEARSHQATVQDVDDISYTKAFWVGVIQVLAILFPGISRSGATIMGGLTLGLSRTAATEFSFFLAVPALLGASLVKLLGVRDLLSVSDIPLFGVGFVVAFIAAMFVIRGLIAFVAHRSFAVFAWYRIVFGGAILVLYWLGIGVGF